MSRLSWSITVAVVIVASWARAEEWPKWRGPRGDGISHESGLLEKWPQEGPPRVWSATVGLGFSSPIGIDSRIYLFTQEGTQDVLTAFDADSGKVVWKQSTPGGYPNDDFGGERATPTIDAGRIYTYGGGGDLICRELSDGKGVWHVNVLQATRSQMLQYGQASSPLVTDVGVYVQGGVGGALAVAVDKASGRVAWQSQMKGQAGYAPPILMEVNGAKQLIVFASSSVVAMDPLTGGTLWSIGWPTSYGVNASTPIAEGDKLFISSGYGQGSALYQVSGNAARQLWSQREVLCKIPSAVLDNGALFCNSEDRDGTLKSVNWSDGTVNWTMRSGRSAKLGFGGTFVKNQDKLISMSQNGLLSLMKITGTGPVLVSQVQLFDESFARVWSTPMIYRGKLYAKGRSELVCLNIIGAAK